MFEKFSAGAIRRSGLGGVALGALLGVTVFSAALADETAPKAKAQEKPAAKSDVVSAKGEDIVVTARKRAEKSQDVPVAITVLGGKHLESVGAANIRNIYREVPTLQVTIPNARNTTLNIRGLGSGIANDGLENAVGVFIDGVYYARPGAATFDLLDLKRVEVLRGPQGTVFGKNTTAGALNIVTAKPSFDPETKVDVSAGNYNYKQFRATTTGPVNDVLAYRFSVNKTTRDGFVDNVRLGIDQNDYDDIGLRGQILYTPNTDFDLRVIADYDKQRNHCCIGVLKDKITQYASGAAFQHGIDSRSAAIGYTPLFADPFDRKTDSDVAILNKTSQHGFSAEANWNIWDGYTLTSTTAYREWAFDPTNDWDYLGASILAANNTVSHQNQFSQELRIASPKGEKIEYVAGLYYFWQRIKSDNLNTFGSDAFKYISPGTALAGIPAVLGTPALTGFTTDDHAEPKTNSYSGFGQATYHVDDQLSLTGGLRYTWENKTASFVRTNSGGAPLSAFSSVPNIQIAPGVFVSQQYLVSAVRNGVAPTAAGAADFTQEHSEGALSGGTSLNYKFTDDLLGYVSFNRGYKSGGINVAYINPANPLAKRVLDPETANSYEIGAKSEWFDKRLRFNVALFWEDVKNYQSTAVWYNSASGTSISYLANVGKVRSRGVEFDAQALPIQGLTLTAAGAFTDAKYLSYENAPCVLEYSNLSTCDASGKIIPGAPRWAGFVGAEYEWPIGDLLSQGLNAYVSGDYNYKSSAQSGTSAYTWVGAYGVANLRIGARLDDRSLDLSLWANNLFDEEYYTAIGGLSFNEGATAGFLGDPRTVGVTLRKTF